MAKSGLTLDAVRKNIDAVDQKLHELLVERGRLSEMVAEIKRPDLAQGGLPMRSAREAQMMRSLAGRDHGPMPIPTILRIWREIIGASAAMQAPMKVAVAGAHDPVSAFDHARSLYGVAVPISLADNPRQVLRALSTGSAQIGVLPEPGQDEAGSWWTSLVDAPFGAVITARLPFLKADDQAPDAERFVVVAQAPLEPSGADQSYIGLLCTGQTSATALAAKLETVGLHGRRIAMISADGGAYHLVELDEFIGPDDARLVQLAAIMGADLTRAVVLGVCPCDISNSEPV